MFPEFRLRILKECLSILIKKLISIFIKKSVLKLISLNNVTTIFTQIHKGKRKMAMKEIGVWWNTTMPVQGIFFTPRWCTNGFCNAIFHNALFFRNATIVL
jgi:hypothetical protein